MAYEGTALAAGWPRGEVHVTALAAAARRNSPLEPVPKRGWPVPAAPPNQR